MEKAVLVGIKLQKDTIPLNESLEELKELVRTAGAKTSGILTQNREMPDIKYFIGIGKLEELKRLCDETSADVIIFDHDLAASQSRNLEKEIGIKVINRTELILDIFAQHAHSREGKLQVELALTEYRLTRLTGHGIEMSRLGGGIGTRGPGETKLEVDRRRINAKVSQLKSELEKVIKSRELLRQKRKQASLETAAIMGYTNSGKSTLLNVLTDARVLVEDKLFATLDPVTRRMYLPSGKIVLLTDTVGFIRKLPHNLISAFRATLEETIGADILIHVVDGSLENCEDKIHAVYSVLEELKVFSKPIITVFNKIDKLRKLADIKELAKKYGPSVLISAEKKIGLDALIELIDRQLEQRA